MFNCFTYITLNEGLHRTGIFSLSELQLLVSISALIPNISSYLDTLTPLGIAAEQHTELQTAFKAFNTLYLIAKNIYAARKKSTIDRRIIGRTALQRLSIHALIARESWLERHDARTQNYVLYGQSFKAAASQNPATAASTTV